MSSSWIAPTRLVARRALLVHSRAATVTAPGHHMMLSTPSHFMSSSSGHSSNSDLQVQQRERLADESILEHIVCPISKYPLRYDAEKGSLICDEINVTYPIRCGVPMLVPSEARIINQEQ